MLTAGDLQHYLTQVLLSALGNDDTPYNGGYSIAVLIEDDVGVIDLTANYPIGYALDDKFNAEVVSIIAPALYPMATLIPNNGPEYVDTGSGDMTKARALRYHFHLGTYTRLNENDVKYRQGKEIPLMSGYGYNPLVNSGHIGLSGSSGSGKTKLAIYLLSRFIYQYGADVHIVDPKLDFDLFRFANNNHIDYHYPKIGDNLNSFGNEAYEVLANAYNEIGKRQEYQINGGKVTRPYIVLVEEAAAYSTKKTKDLLEKCILMGRSAMCWIIVSAQSFDATSVISSTSRDSLGLRVVLSNNPTAEDCRYLLKGFDPSNLVIPRDEYPFGRGLIQQKSDGQILPFLAPIIKSTE